MELMKIGHNALKVTLSKEDMDFYDIEFDMLDYTNVETRRVIWSILDEANRSLGFEFSKDSLYIQAFRSRCGGCELFVSHEEKKAEPMLFRFDNSENIIIGCARLKNCGFEGKSLAYTGDCGSFYLELHAEDDKYIYLDELSLRLPYSESYLSEHTKLLCDNAVETFAALR